MTVKTLGVFFSATLTDIIDYIDMPSQQPAPIDPQPRDLSLLRGLFESRVMTAAHIAVLYFDGKEEATKKRLQKLKAAGLISERRRKPYEPAILSLTTKAFALLRREGVLTEYPHLDSSSLERRTRVSDLTLRHELDIMDVKAAFHLSLARIKRFQLTEFTTWPLLYQFEAARPGHRSGEVQVKPDGFLRILEQEEDGQESEHTFFLEVDRSSETQETLVNRAGCYLEYYRSGGFAVRNGAPRTDFKEFPFRVLMVFKTAERRNNTAERLLASNFPVLRMVALSSFEEVKKNPLGNIWIRPVDYRTATDGTNFESSWETDGQSRIYRRQSARDVHVERRVKKHGILDQES